MKFEHVILRTLFAMCLFVGVPACGSAACGALPQADALGYGEYAHSVVDGYISREREWLDAHRKSPQDESISFPVASLQQCSSDVLEGVADCIWRKTGGPGRGLDCAERKAVMHLAWLIRMRKRAEAEGVQGFGIIIHAEPIISAYVCAAIGALSMDRSADLNQLPWPEDMLPFFLLTDLERIIFSFARTHRLKSDLPEARAAKWHTWEKIQAYIDEQEYQGVRFKELRAQQDEPLEAVLQSRIGAAGRMVTEYAGQVMRLPAGMVVLSNVQKAALLAAATTATVLAVNRAKVGAVLRTAGSTVARTARAVQERLFGADKQDTGQHEEGVVDGNQPV